MKKFIPMIATGILLIASNTVSYASPSTDSPQVDYTQAQVNLMMDMRSLWEDHIVYTRNFIISDIANLGDVTAVTARLMKNQDDIGAAIKPYYDEATSNILTTLLREHIQISGDVVDAAIKKDTAKLKSAQSKWTENADAIATFLASTNPNWNKAELKNMIHTHLKFTTEQVTARLKKDWSADIDAYDENHVHMLMFADTLSDGIIKQFPDKFK